MKLSIIIPVLDGINIDKIYEEISNLFKKKLYEIIYVSNVDINYIYEKDMIHNRIVYLSNVYDINDMINIGLSNAYSEYYIVIDNNFKIDNLFMMMELLDNEDVDIVSTGYEDNNGKRDSFGYRMFKNCVRSSILEIGYSNKVFNILNYNTKYLEMDKRDIKNSILDCFNKLSLLSIICFSISIIFIIISIISIFKSNIILFSIWFCFGTLIFLLGIISIYLNKLNRRKVIIKKRIGFNDKDIL